MSYPSFRIGARCALAGAFLFPCVSAPAADRFAVSASQMQALGITLQRLDQPSAIAGMAYPAQVVLPPQQEHVVSAPVAGVVDQLLVSGHDALKAGQPLLRLASPGFGALQLELLEAANRNRLARQTREREKQLFAEGIVPQRRVLEADAAASDARGRLEHASAALKLAGVDDGAIRRLVAGGKPEEALTLRARASGIVVDLDARLGQRVAAADPLLRIADPSRLWLDIRIPASRATSWAKNGTIAIVGRTARATATSLASTVGEDQTVSLRAEVTQGVDQLRPGEFVQAQVPFANTASAWSLPLGAVVRQGEKAHVFARTPDGFEVREIHVVASAAQSTSVEGPLKPGDEIAVTNVIALKAAWLGESGGE